MEILHPILTLMSLTFLQIIPSGSSFGSGDPMSEETCKWMIPKHDLEGQATPSPYNIYLGRTEVKAGEKIKFEICSSKNKIQEFLVQGRRLDDASEVPAGTFEPAPGYEKVVQMRNCGGGETPNFITQFDREDKPKVKFIWTAPMEPGSYRILATVIKNPETFWVKQPSSRITVT